MLDADPVERRPATQAETSPLNIALLGYRSNPYSGGQGIYLHYLSKALLEAGHRVDVISGPPYPHLVPGVRLIKLPSLDLYNEPNHVTALRWRHLKSFTDTFEYFDMLTGGFPEPYTFGRRLTKYFRAMKPAYDIIHDNQSLCYGTLALQRDYPLVTTVHHPITSDRELALASATGWRERLLIKRWHSFIGMQRKVVSRLKHIVTVSHVSAADVARAFGLDQRELHVIHNGIDTQTFSPQPDVSKVPFRIMATASADQPLKGLRYLLEAIAQLESTYPDIHLVVVGKLKEGGETDRLIDQLGIRERLRFVSGIETAEIADLYAGAAIAVVPSIYEGFGFPAGEAMACGVPVISTNGGALPEVVGDAGLVVPVRDAAAIAGKITYLLEHPDEAAAIGAAGRRHIEQQFSWQIAAERMVAMYRDVIAAHEAA